jgi:hypothetical protein
MLHVSTKIGDVAALSLLMSYGLELMYERQVYLNKYQNILTGDLLLAIALKYSNIIIVEYLVSLGYQRTPTGDYAATQFAVRDYPTSWPNLVTTPPKELTDAIDRGMKEYKVSLYSLMMTSLHHDTFTIVASYLAAPTPLTSNTPLDEDEELAIQRLAMMRATNPRGRQLWTGLTTMSVFAMDRR